MVEYSEVIQYAKKNGISGMKIAQILKTSRQHLHTKSKTTISTRQSNIVKSLIDDYYAKQITEQEFEVEFKTLDDMIITEKFLKIDHHDAETIKAKIRTIVLVARLEKDDMKRLKATSVILSAMQSKDSVDSLKVLSLLDYLYKLNFETDIDENQSTETLKYEFEFANAFRRVLNKDQFADVQEYVETINDKISKRDKSKVIIEKELARYEDGLITKDEFLKLISNVKAIEKK